MALVKNTTILSTPAVAPQVTASDSLSSRTLTISVDSLTGNPTPTASLTSLTLDGVDVSGDASGTGPWTYAVPSSQSAQAVSWEVTAASNLGSATATGSEDVTENQVPTIDTAPAITGTLEVGEVVSVTPGVWNGDVDSYAYQWTRDGSNISGATGSTYTLAALDEGAVIGCEVTPTNAAGTGSPATATGGGTVGAGAPATFAISSTLGDFRANYASAPFVNPGGVHFRTNLSPNGDYLDKPGSWEWDFGDTGATFSRLAAWWPWANNANKSNSPFPVHTYEAPGTYLVTCTHVDKDGVTHEATTTVEIQNRDTWFASKATSIYYVSPTDDFPGDAPAGAHFVNTVAEAFDNLTAGKDRWILLNEGETHQVDTVYAIAPSPTIGGGHVHILDSYGDGSSDAILYLSNTSSSIRSRGFGHKIITGNIKITSNFDATDESGAKTSAAAIDYEENSGHLTVCGISSKGTTNVSNQADGTNPAIGNVFSNCLFEEFVAVGHYHANVKWCGHAGVATLGNPDGMGGGSGRAGDDPLATARHGPYRFIQQYQCSFEHIWTFSNAGWTTLPGAGGLRRPVHQPHVRVNTNGLYDTSIYVGKHVAEGGSTYASIWAGGGTNRVNDNVPGDHLFEDFIYVGSANTKLPAEVGFPGACLRNGVMIIPNAPPELGAGVAAMFFPGTIGLENPADASIPIRIENILIVDLRNAANGPDIEIPLVVEDSGDNSYEAVGMNRPLFSGMARYTPNITTPATSDGPFDTTELVAPLYKGLQHLVIYENNDGVNVETPAQALDTAYATPAGTISLYRPATGAGVLDDQTTDIPPRDLLGNDRGNPTARGPYDDVAA